MTSSRHDQPVIATYDAADLPARRDELLERRQPAVISGLFKGQLLGELTDAQKVREALGDLQVMIGVNYIDAHLANIRNFVQGSSAPIAIDKKPGLLRDYLDLIEREPTTRALTSEQPTPERILDDCNLGAVGIEKVHGGYGNPLAQRSASEAHSLMFVANAGNASDLHTDWDGRDVLLHQVFGRKRIVLFPPKSGFKLFPIDIFSTVAVNAMDDAERAALIAYAGGVEVVVEAGETILMPAFWWHHVGYVDAAMSVSFRFGGVTDPDAVALIGSVHRDCHIQNIVAGTLDPRRAEASKAAARRLRAAAAEPAPSAREKYRAMRILAAECYRSTLLPGEQAPAEPVITAEDFLDGALCAFYRRPPKGPAWRQRLWQKRETFNEAVRRFGRRLAYQA
ncbi:cupin-like domain-containing protein [Bradyrhizobium sp. SZCCHNS3002]|uniref:cupin-like domain-containing protein n=1 Tax=Bradyrhizobium sp. SZCCHNS3002 TaxID=3057310 RepID=UPI0028ECA812|nr:cupin-like domain-containing protein [Bradyrhizobium sp. SZCCHNS3002]